MYSCYVDVSDIFNQHYCILAQIVYLEIINIKKSQIGIGSLHPHFIFIVSEHEDDNEHEVVCILYMEWNTGIYSS